MREEVKQELMDGDHDMEDDEEEVELNPADILNSQMQVTEEFKHEPSNGFTSIRPSSSSTNHSIFQGDPSTAIAPLIADDGSLKYKCEECDALCSTPGNLKQHKQSKHE